MVISVLYVMWAGRWSAVRRTRYVYYIAHIRRYLRARAVVRFWALDVIRYRTRPSPNRWVYTYSINSFPITLLSKHVGSSLEITWYKICILFSI